MTSPLALNGGLDGLWVPIITPFDSSDNIDVVGLEKLVRRLLGQGARGVVALGTTGEPSVLTSGESSQVISAVDSVCTELNAPMIVGVGTNNTRETIAAAQTLTSFESVCAALVVVPYYTRPSGAAIVDHYRSIAAASPVPIVAYNIPYRTGRALTADELLQIANTNNVAGLKQSVGGIDLDTLCVLRNAPEGFSVLAGDDAYIAPTILVGGRGAIAAAAHLHTERFAQ